jgi:hypothetical protein
MRRAFAFGNGAQQVGAEYAPWWNDECAQWHSVMGAKMRAAHRQEAQDKGFPAWREFVQGSQARVQSSAQAGDGGI